MTSGAVARCVGLSADTAPEDEKTLEKILASGCSADEPAGTAPDSEGTEGTAALAPLLLLARKRVLRAGDRSELILGGKSAQWEEAVANGPTGAIELVNQHTTTNETELSLAESLHMILCEESQPLSWWRALHGIMCLAQLPHADGFDLEVDREMSVNPGAPSMVNHRARSHSRNGSAEDGAMRTAHRPPLTSHLSVLVCLCMVAFRLRSHVLGRHRGRSSGRMRLRTSSPSG